MLTLPDGSRLRRDKLRFSGLKRLEVDLPHRSLETTVVKLRLFLSTDSGATGLNLQVAVSYQ